MGIVLPSREYAVTNDIESSGMFAPNDIIITATLAELFRASSQFPSSLVALRGEWVEPVDLPKIAAVLGGTFSHDAFGDVRAIAFDPAAKGSIALSAAAHPPHLDGTFAAKPPSAFLLSFEKSDPKGGGVSTFWPIADLLAECPWELMEAGLTATVCFERQRHDTGEMDTAVGQLIEKDPQGRILLRWRDDEHVSPKVLDDHGKPIQQFIAWVREYLANTQPIEFAACDGDTILIPQHAFLHGRTALSGTESPRLVYRTWVY